MATKTTAAVPSLTSPRDLIAIDPGNKVSAWVVFRPWRHPDGKSSPFKIISFGRLENTNLRMYLRRIPKDKRVKSRLITEMLRARGMPTSNEEFETCVQIGRVIQAWLPGTWSYAFRGDIKLCLCGDSRAKDPNVRQALIELWGGEKRALGGKKCSKCKGKGWFGAGRPVCTGCHGEGWEIKPGPLNNIASDEWAALAVAYWWVAEGTVHHAVPPPKTKKRKRSRGRRDSVTVAAAQRAGKRK